MTNPQERIPSPEILSVTEADAYIRAVTTVFSQNQLTIPGLRYEAGRSVSATNTGIDPSSSIVLESTLDSADQPIVFRLVAYQPDAFNETTIEQSVEGNVGQDVAVRRWHRALSEETNYVTVRSTEDGEKILWKGIKSEIDRKEAEALFATLTTDFKTHLEKKLAPRADLLDAIELTARLPKDEEQKKRRRSFVGNLVLRRRFNLGR